MKPYPILTKSIRWITALAAACITTGALSAQEPIVAIKVMPENRVFKTSSFNKPIVVKSKEGPPSISERMPFRHWSRRSISKSSSCHLSAGFGRRSAQLQRAESFPNKFPSPGNLEGRVTCGPMQGLRLAFQREVERAGQEVDDQPNQASGAGSPIRPRGILGYGAALGKAIALYLEATDERNYHE